MKRNLISRGKYINIIFKLNEKELFEESNKKTMTRNRNINCDDELFGMNTNFRFNKENKGI